MLRTQTEQNFIINDFSKENFKMYLRRIHLNIFGTIIFKPNSFLIDEYRDRELSIDDIFELILEYYDHIKGIMFAIRDSDVRVRVSIGGLRKVGYLYIMTGLELKSIRNTDIHLAPHLLDELKDDIYYIIICRSADNRFLEKPRLIDITRVFRIKYNFKRFTIELFKDDIKTINTFDNKDQYDLLILNRRSQYYTLNINNLYNFLLIDIDNIKLIELKDKLFAMVKKFFLIPIRGSDLISIITTDSLLYNNVDIIDDDFYLLLHNPYSEDKPILITIQDPVQIDNNINITRIYHFPRYDFNDPIVISECTICLESKNYNNDDPNDYFNVITLECGHTFHKGCIDNYNRAARNPLCPNCRNSRSSLYNSIHLGGSKMKYIKYKKKYLNL